MNRFRCAISPISIINRKKIKKPVIIVSAGVVLALAVLCCVTFALGVFEGSPPRYITCSEIVAAHKGITDLQWQVFKNTVHGDTINFSGTVTQVYGNNSASVSNNTDCGETLNNIPHNIATGLYKGQQV